MTSGSTAGTNTTRVMEIAFRPSTRPTMMNTGRMLATAPMVERAMGGIPNITPNATLAGNPSPNANRTRGYSTTFGIEAKPISIGTSSSPDKR